MNDLIYLDTYVVQQDMRIRLPKSVLSNLDINKGQTKLDIYLDLAEKSLVCGNLIMTIEESSNDKYTSSLSFYWCWWYGRWI